MTDRPLIFSGPMVRALLSGTNTQTRRLINPKPAEFTPQVSDIGRPYFDADEGRWGQIKTEWSSPSWGAPVGKPMREVFVPLSVHFEVGGRLWVREAWRTEARNDFIWPRDLRRGVPVYFEAGGGGEEALPECAGKLRPSLFMPRWASRLTLVVTEVRVERLQDISEADARAEGISQCGRFYGVADTDWDFASTKSARDAFANFWDGLNAKRLGCAWADNPWVVAITFAVHTVNIDVLGSEVPS